MTIIRPRFELLEQALISAPCALEEEAMSRSTLLGSVEVRLPYVTALLL
jgi:hypothetical protein